MPVDPTHTKYLIKATITADGVIEKPDIIGAVFGQTEGLLGNEMDLRDLQKGARIGRIEVDVQNNRGKSTGTIILPSAMDKVESAILAAALETIDRIGPAKAVVRVDKIEDQRISKRTQVMDRAKELLAMINDDPEQDTGRISDEVRSAVQVADIAKFRNTKIWCGPNVETGDSIIIVEGRSDVLNLLKFGIKNTIAVEGTNVPDEIKELTLEKTTTIFVDGDRGGELIARELLETCEVDFVARAPSTREVEELPHKLVMKCLKNKVTADQFISQNNINIKKDGDRAKPVAKKTVKPAGRRDDGDDNRSRGRGRGRRSDDDQDKPAGRRSDDDEQPARGRRSNDDQDKPARGRRSDDAEDRKPARGRSQAPDDKPARASRSDDEDKPRRAPAKKAAKKTVRKPDDPRTGLADSLAGLSGSLKANLLDDTGSIIRADLPVRELADTLKAGKDKVHTVVFDGVITQRLLDIAADRKVQTVVGVKMGNVSKVPDTVEILTRDDLN